MVESAILLQSAAEWFNNFMRNVRIIDIFDIAVIAFFLYILLSWLRESASRRTVISFLILITVYAVASFSSMYMTERLLEAVFVIIFIGLVVAYQSDIRRMIDRLGSWSFFKKSRPTSSTDIATSIITEAAAQMADERTGALIVIRGSEEWDRHIHGGTELNGQITTTLLHSIFNTKAPGHDGAILLEGRHISKFGVHLPLSTNLHKMSRGGTRHTAALGLSEQCDALVVVVSEERGSISIAQDGRIHELEDNSALKQHLDDFWATHYQTQSGSFTEWWKRRSLVTATAAVVLSFLIWLAYAFPSDTVIRSYDLPIEYRNMESTNIALQDSVPSQARVDLSGSEQAFRTLDASGLVISFDMASDDAKDGILQINENHINLPPDLRFYNSSPASLKLKNQTLSNFEVPVKVTTSGNLRNGLEMVSISASPSIVQVLADTSTALPDSVSTETVNLSNVQNSATIQKRLQIDNESLRLPDDVSNQVYIKIEVRKTSE